MKLKNFYFLNLRGLMMFFKPKALTNMSLVFLLILFVPMVTQLFRGTHHSILPEKEELTENTQSSLGSWFLSFHQYNRVYNRHFVFRDPLIRARNLIYLKLFGVSPVPKVIVGKEGWLFQARRNKEPNEAGYFSSIQPFQESELEQWRTALEQRQHWLADRNIYYLLILAPDKSSIYPDYLPFSLRPFYDPKKSRLEQLVQYLKKHSHIPVLDLRPALLKAKEKHIIYYKSDSHWNEYGACIAYGEIIKHLAAVFKTPGKILPRDIPGFRITRAKLKNANLTMMLSIPGTIFPENRIRLQPRVPFQWYKASLPQIKISSTVKSSATEHPSADFPNAVMLHDSFGRYLKRFLSEHFSRIVYLRDWGFHFHIKIIESEKPGIVLDEITEHFLYNQTLSNPQEVAHYDQ